MIDINTQMEGERMNREEILNLPDKEIDRLIAEKWMRWKYANNYYVPDCWITNKSSSPTSFMPSTNISDAMEALDKVKVDKKVSRCIIEITKEDYFVTVISPDYFPNDRVIVKDKSLPKAICLCICLYLNEKGEL